MKNLKKVLAMVLAFACTFSMFAGAKVFEDVPAGSDYSEAVTMLSDLGIIQGKDDGKYHPEDTITRAEACAMIARLMTGDPNVSQYVGAQSFTDVAKGSWKDSAIGYCYINGIVIGVGNNKFEPDRAITDAEFITMVVRAMGYETADMKQNYPFSYMSNAQAVGLLDGTNMVASTDALRGEDAQVIYNALFADYARGAKLVNTTHGTSVESYPTLAESVWGLQRAAVGVWQKSTKDDETMELTTCKAHTWVITGKSMTVGNVDMFEAYPIEDGETMLYDNGEKNGDTPYYFTYNGDMANIADLKGYQVELWGMGAHDEPELETVTDENGDSKKVYVYSSDWDINAIKTVKGQTKFDYTPADEELPDVDLDEVRGFVGGTIASDINWGKDSLTEKEVEDALQTKNSASYRVVDWDSDGTADFVVGDIYKYYEVKAVTSKTVRLGGFDGKTEFVLDLDGETDVKIGGQDYTVKAELPDDLAEGDVLQVSTEDVVAKKKIESTWTVTKVEPETKEITSISSKKGVEFDDELIDVAHQNYSFKDTNSTYNDLNEDSDDLWDLYLDNNGFIIKMEEAEGAFTGYLFVTGADQGNNSSTGNRRSAKISGVNDKNEYMEDLELTKNANVEVWDGDSYEDGYDDREFNNVAGNIKGRVFKYTLNDDGDVTRLVEVACENASADYSYDNKSNAVTTKDNGQLATNYGEKNARNWLQKASVIFAVEVNDEEWNTIANDDYDPMNENRANITAGTVLGMGGGDDNDANDDDIDAGNVIAIDYTEVPDINGINGDDPAARGIKYNVDQSKDEVETVVLGVTDLNDFKSTSTKVALLTQLDWYNKGDKEGTYDITAYVNGEEETEFNSIDYTDMTVNGDTNDAAVKNHLDAVNDYIEDSGKNGVYAELRFNKDGKVTEVNIIDTSFAFQNPDIPIASGSVESSKENVSVFNRASEDEHYTVVRAVVNLRNDGDTLMVTPAKGIYDKNADEMKLESVDNAEFFRYYNLVSDTAYYEIDGQPVIKDGQFMDAYNEGFDDDFAVAAGDKADLVSWIDSVNDEYEDAYCVADVVIDNTKAEGDNDVVAVYYYNDTVAEYGMLEGTVKLNKGTNVTYADSVVVDVTCNDSNLKTGSLETTLYAIVDGKKVAVGTREGAGTLDFGTQDVGSYYVEATGINKATEKGDRQKIDGIYFDVLEGNLDADNNAEITIDPKHNQQVVLSGIDVKDLPKESFTVYQNSSKLPQDQDKYDFYYDENDGTYNFIIKAGASVTDSIKIVVSYKNYNLEEVVYEGKEVEPEEVAVTLTGSANATDNTITLNVSSNVGADARAMLASTDVWKVVKTDADNAPINVNKIEVNAGGTITLSTADLYQTAPYQVSLDMTLNGVHYTGTVDVVGA